MTLPVSPLELQKGDTSAIATQSVESGNFVGFIGTMLFRLETVHDSLDNHDSACKDAASLLHNIGKRGSDIQCIDLSVMSTKWSRQYQCLLSHLRSLSGKPITPLSSRVVYVEFAPSRGRISYDNLRRIFPNVQKIWRVIMSKSKCSCLVEFASHSSARRAVDARQETSQCTKCTWVSPSVEIPPMRVSKETSFPIMEYLDDDSVIAPSTDWRRPRPTENHKDAFSQFDLVTFLRQTGAFDDYPPESTVIFSV